MNRTQLAAILIWPALLGACGGSASRAGRGGDSSDAGEPGVSGSTGAGASNSMGGAPAAGGSTDGGSSPVASAGKAGWGQAGSGGVGGADALPLPPGCEPRARTETDTSCTLNAYCSSQSQITHCGKLPSGRWQCGCDRDEERTFEVEGAPGLQACAAAVGLCGADEAELGDEHCVTRVDDSSEIACRINVGCSREVAIDLAPHVRGKLVREGSVECYRTESGQSFECGCMDDGVFSEHDLVVDSGTLACGPLLDFCMNGDEPDFAGEERCVLMNATSDGEGCERTEGCSSLMPLSEAVDLAEFAPHHASCVPRAGGGADCYCSTPTSSTLRLEMSEAPDDATCAFANAACAKDADILPAGDISCEAQSQTEFGSTSCEADLTCYQAATVDGRTLVAEGRLLVRCARAEPTDAWQCSCASDQTTARFQLGAADASAATACTQAPLGCLEHLDVHLGPYGEFVYPPDPLAP